MKYTIRWKDCNKSLELESYIAEKIEKFKDFNFVLDNAKIEIVYYAKQKSYKSRINIHVAKKGLLRAESAAKDIITAFNDTTDKIFDQLRRVKTKFGR